MDTLIFFTAFALASYLCFKLYLSAKNQSGNFYLHIAKKSFEYMVILLVFFTLSTIIEGLEGPLSSLISGIMCLFGSFSLLGLGFYFINRRQSKFIHSFFVMGIGLNILLAYFLTLERGLGSESAPLYFLNQAAMIHLFANISGLVCISLLTLFFGLFIPSRGVVSKPRRYKSAGRNILNHYHEQGLSKDEIEYFRQQMGPAKQSIINIEKQMNQHAKLRAIEVRHNTVEVAQSFFKDIVNEPKRLPEVSDFLYKYLPSLDDLCHKYNEINQHVAKNKQTYLLLDKSAQTIETLCQQITQDYLTFHQDQFNQLNDEIELANKNIIRIKPKSQPNTSESNKAEEIDSVTEILKEEL